MTIKPLFRHTLSLGIIIFSLFVYNGASISAGEKPSRYTPDIDAKSSNGVIPTASVNESLELAAVKNGKAVAGATGARTHIYTIQIATYRSKPNAEKHFLNIVNMAVSNETGPDLRLEKGSHYYIIRAGKFNNLQSARNAQVSMGKRFPNAIVVKVLNKRRNLLLIQEKPREIATEPQALVESKIQLASLPLEPSGINSRTVVAAAKPPKAAIEPQSVSTTASAVLSTKDNKAANKQADQSIIPSKDANLAPKALVPVSTTHDLMGKTIDRKTVRPHPAEPGERVLVAKKGTIIGVSSNGMGFSEPNKLASLREIVQSTGPRYKLLPYTGNRYLFLVYISAAMITIIACVGFIYKRKKKAPVTASADHNQIASERSELPRLSKHNEDNLSKNIRELSMVEGNVSLYKSKSERVKTIYVTSCFHAEGKTTAAINMAYALTLNGKSKVLLVEGNPRSPQVHKRFHTRQSPGNLDLSQPDEGIERIITKTKYNNLSLFKFGSISDKHSKFTVENWIKNACNYLCPHFDYILTDGNSVLGSSDTIMVANQYDGIVLVVEAEKTKWEVVQSTVSKITMGGGNVIGIVLNKRKFYIPKFLYGKI